MIAGPAPAQGSIIRMIYPNRSHLSRRFEVVAGAGTPTKSRYSQTTDTHSCGPPRSGERPGRIKIGLTALPNLTLRDCGRELRAVATPHPVSVARWSNAHQSHFGVDAKCRQRKKTYDKHNMGSFSMTAHVQPLSANLVQEMLQLVARAICDRPGENTALRETRTNQMVHATLGFAPRDGLELMLARLATGHTAAR